MGKIAEIIKYEGDNNIFIWKHPCEDFNTLTQLIVHESQEAIFFMNGEALDTFGPGRHTLETSNIPKLAKFFNKVVGGETPFHCEVYFINKTVQMGGKWGTDAKVRFIDPESGIPLEIGACGEYNLKVEDGRKLLVKLVGTMRGISWELSGEGLTKSIIQSFRPLISMQVKNTLVNKIKELNVNIVEIDGHLEELSKALKDKINEGFAEYGLSIPNFYITNVLLPEDDPNFKTIKELYTVGLRTRAERARATVESSKAFADADILAAQRQAELERQVTQTEVARREAERKVIEAQSAAEAAKLQGMAEAEVMQAKHYDERDVLQAEVQKAYAEGMGNMGSNGGSGGGGLASDLVGMMAGMKMANEMMNKMDSTINPNPSPQAAPSNNDFQQKVEKLKMMKEAGLLSEEEFNEMKAKLLASIL